MDQSLPIPILIKDEKYLNGLEVIDLDEQVSSEDIVLEWCTKVRLKFKSFFIADTERSLDTLMKWYIQFLKEEAMNIDDYSILKVEVGKHIDFFKIIFSELDCPFVDNYLDNMEDILALYFDLEVSTLQKKQSVNYGNTVKIIGRKLISTFNSFLMCREERVHHVLMKIKLTSSEANTDLINFLYGKLLTKKSTNKSDLAFCRTYILYQKWKTIQKPDYWQEMDRVMYERFDRTPDSLKSNQTLNQILFPQNESVLNVLTHISNNYTMMSEEYFKFMRSQNIHEDGIVPLEVINVDLDKLAPSEEVEEGEHESFHRVYNDYVESMGNVTISCDSVPSTNGNVQPASTGIDDECVIVGVGTIDFGQSSSDLVCDISDDEDISDIIFFQPKQENPTERKKTKKKCREVPVSFLDSIDITDQPCQDLSSPPLSPIIFTTVTSPLSKESSDSGPKSDFSVPKLPRRTSKAAAAVGKSMKKHILARKKLSSRKMERRKIFLEKRRRQQQQQTDDNNRKEMGAPDPEVETTSTKEFNHIETQTDFQSAEETEEIFRPYKCLVTPPSEHHEDREIDLAESQVYANILPSTSICTLEVDSNREEIALVPEELAAQETTGPEEDPVPPDETDSSQVVAVSDLNSDFSPSSSNNTVSISSSKRADSPTSPDVSSTSHDNDAKTGETSAEGGAVVVRSLPTTIRPAHPNVGDKWICRDFDKFQEKMNAAAAAAAASEGKCGRVHSQWDALIANHGLQDDFLTGPIIRKVNGANGCVNPYKNFDLFGNETPNNKALAGRATSIPNDASKNICDFGNYLTTYKEQNGAATADPFKTPRSVALPRTDAAAPNDVDCKPKGKKKTLSFADVTIMEKVMPQHHDPLAIPSSAVQSILKKPPVRRRRKRERLRIPRRQMNLRSLRRYGVEPGDLCLQGDLKIVLERIGDDEISRWETMSEISRKVRLQRRQALDMLSTSLCRVDYDKSTLTLNENDRIQYNTFDDYDDTTTVAVRHLRFDYDDELRRSGRQEGDLPYTVKKNGKRKSDSIPILPHEKQFTKKRGRPPKAQQKIHL